MKTSQLAAKDLKGYAAVALALAEEGGAVLKHYWGNLHDICDKELAGDLVTEADKESERRILALLQREYPDHSALAEESGQHAKHKSDFPSDFLWIIDPLDGTTNYAHQYPVVAVSVALVFRGQPVVGVVLNPLQGELYQATIGSGATLNGQTIKVSAARNLAKSLLASGFAYDRRQTADNNYAEFCHLTNLTQGVRRGGSAALDLAYVAAGRCDGYWERGIKAWDIAAGSLLVQEAGGMVTGYDGAPLDLYGGRILATNGHLHPALSAELLRVKTGA